MSSRHLRRLAGCVVGLLLAGAAVTGSAPAAEAARPAAPAASFVSVDATTVGCRGARIHAIGGDAGVRYLHRGERLRFPTRVLPFDRYGVVELTARARGGRAVTQATGRVVAPASCSTAITPGDEPRLGPVLSWCAGSAAPSLGQVFSSDSPETQTATWRLVRRTNHRVVARGTFALDLGVAFQAFPLPAGLPLGRYVLEVRNAASSPELFPYALRVEQYRCLPTPAVRTGAVVFRVPAGGPDARIEVFDRVPQVPTAVLTVRAGGRATYRTTASSLSYVAHPLGDHVGTLGSGSLEVPQG